MKQVMRLWFGVPFMLLLSFTLAACGSSGPSQADYDSLNEKVAGLEQQLAEVEKALEGMKSNAVAASVDVPEGETATLAPVDNGPSDNGDGVQITLEQYEKTEVGMTYKEVSEILGGDGEAVSEAEDMVVYSYHGTGDLGANAVFSFHKGKLLTKAQAGLE
ncbi:beta-lactamase inhibitor (BLIP) [Fontibacillus phaseoli]|uniref:Beta-lactamase inhibitor (BLIP) n=1 Tax=Fontibacillus phaseoli TaxID=1416533 RepID=A0A369B8G2_9BACL|nr:hypothetical protein [Fontibacillus phaseoli]RCX17711.1 beta-lactamase inhibitor (BLIP) [Fontibacillus phaseoli]